MKRLISNFLLLLIMSFSSLCGMQPVVEQILAHFGFPDISGVKSAPLRGTIPGVPEETLLGYARSFDGNIVIQLLGLTQEKNMDCGVASLVNARILRDHRNYPVVQQKLLDPATVKAGQQRVREIMREHMTPKQIEETIARGLTIEDFFGRRPERNAVVLVEQESMGEFGLFPSPAQREKFGAVLGITYTFARPDVPFYLPRICVIRIGRLTQPGGHWIAARFERLSDGRIGIVFVDSVQYCEGIFKDKIEDYENYFRSWFKEMPRYLGKEKVKPVPIGLSEDVHRNLEALIAGIIIGSLDTRINEMVDQLGFKDIRVQFTTDPRENDRRRIALLKKLAAKSVRMSDAIRAILLGMLDVLGPQSAEGILITQAMGEL